MNVDHIQFSAQPARTSRQRYFWADYGKDFYAAGTLTEAPGHELVWIGWNPLTRTEPVLSGNRLRPSALTRETARAESPADAA
ncbi:hypothetical protein [Actinomadura sp. 6N118]|uniref:hypothetical protein n=1 Tax=Actinomadura sp. 6N118 TaxID=3375151 RepID=UPI0037B7FA28